MTWHFWRKHNPEDFSEYLPKGSASNREKLIAECRKRGVPIHVANQSETSSGPYAALRAVAPESELQARLLQAITTDHARNANRIAWLALVVGVAGLIITLAK
jgi:hypothetical protein